MACTSTTLAQPAGIPFETWSIHAYMHVLIMYTITKMYSYIRSYLHTHIHIRIYSYVYRDMCMGAGVLYVYCDDKLKSFIAQMHACMHAPCSMYEVGKHSYIICIVTHCVFILCMCVFTQKLRLIRQRWWKDAAISWQTWHIPIVNTCL